MIGLLFFRFSCYIEIVSLLCSNAVVWSDVVVNNKEHSPVSGQRNVSKAPLAPGSAAPAVVRSTLVSDRDHFLTNIASFKLIILLDAVSV